MSLCPPPAPLAVLPPACVSALSGASSVGTLAHALDELLCNSLDAGATRIDATVDAAQGSLWVDDDGCGVPASQLALLGVRHATSKLASLAQLRPPPGGAPHPTLGFRGEALAALAACSLVEVRTRAAGEWDTGLAALAPGRAPSAGLSPQPRPSHGTSVCVRAFLHTLPVRRRAAAADAGAELGRCCERVARHALASDGAALTLCDASAAPAAPSRLLLRFPARRTPAATFGALYGPALGALACPLLPPGGGGGVVAGGVACAPPAGGLPTAEAQHVFVNGRWVARGPLHRLLDAMWRAAAAAVAAAAAAGGGGGRGAGGCGAPLRAAFALRLRLPGAPVSADPGGGGVCAAAHAPGAIPVAAAAAVLAAWRAAGVPPAALLAASRAAGVAAPQPPAPAPARWLPARAPDGALEDGGGFDDMPAAGDGDGDGDAARGRKRPAPACDCGAAAGGGCGGCGRGAGWPLGAQPPAAWPRRKPAAPPPPPRAPARQLPKPGGAAAAAAAPPPAAAPQPPPAPPPCATAASLGLAPSTVGAPPPPPPNGAAPAAGRPPPLAGLRALGGSVAASVVLALHPLTGCLVAVDQHAADERVLLEALTAGAVADVVGPGGGGGGPAPSAPTPPPHPRLRPTPRCAAALAAHAAVVARAGWAWRWAAAAEDEEGGGGGCGAGFVAPASAPLLVLRAPLLCGSPLPASALAEWLYELGGGGGGASAAGGGGAGDPPGGPAAARRLASKACRGSIMFGDALSLSEAGSLCAALGACGAPLACAHGRPTAAPLLDLPAARRRAAALEQADRAQGRAPAGYERALGRLRAAG